MRFDKFFYTQRKRGNPRFEMDDIVDLDNFRLTGTEKHPVKIIGEIKMLEVEGYDLSFRNDFYILLDSPDAITVRLILEQPFPRGLLMQGLSYFIQFLFYDFSKTMYLVLFNAKITKIGSCCTVGNLRRFTITISSIRDDLCPAYKVFETKHVTI